LADTRQRRVQLWASQLIANDFPPVCAMTGLPAETWRRFNFPSLLAMSQVVSGHLPLTRSSSRTVALAVWIPLTLLWASAVLLVAAFVFAAAAKWSFPLFFLLGLAVLLAGFLGRMVAMKLMCPRGKVTAIQPGHYDRIVELSNVHPAFVAAVQQHQHARSAQAYGQHAAVPPESR
jgi:hypothetical protein